MHNTVYIIKRYFLCFILISSVAFTDIGDGGHVCGTRFKKGFTRGRGGRFVSKQYMTGMRTYWNPSLKTVPSAECLLHHEWNDHRGVYHNPGDNIMVVPGVL